jgi:hypothetical protein
MLKYNNFDTFEQIEVKKLLLNLYTGYVNQLIDHFNIYLFHQFMKYIIQIYYINRFFILYSRLAFR